MSEELLQTLPQEIGKYTYYRLGSTTLSQLRNNGIIPKKSYATLSAKKPDGLVLYHGAIKAVVEYKQPKDLRSPTLVKKAIAQEIDVAKALCKILIVTDGSQSFWINALTGQPVRDAKGDEVRAVFHPFVAKNTNLIEYLLDEIDASIHEKNSTIRSAKIIDPSPLAARLWQTIWVATGKSPVKCLYNVVELFIFKFLSDLNVLGDDISFARIYAKSLADPEDGLEFYARNTRKKIYKLFPPGSDGTTIINGTIFVNETGEANLSQSILFQRSLEHLQRYSEQFGSLTRIDKQFKTRLYESFLKQEVEALGQYFTPRRVVQSMIRMAGLHAPTFQFAGRRFCDPFCGVGGFPLELLNMNESMRAAYTPDSSGRIEPPFTLHGFDKGFERDDERTIILAKANMLIYLAELLFASPDCSREFARIFNETFQLFKDNLGTFGHIITSDTAKYDYILSNPPYVTSGSSIIKEEILRTPRTAKAYPVNALGLEGLSVEWIVRSLRSGGQALIVVPDGILGRVGERKLRDHILRECYLDAIVSLPVRTFFANAEHTYIVAITKKHDPDHAQTDPVFTFLVSNIGERLTSVRREEIPEDDLPEMERLFRVFASAKASTRAMLERESGRCKIIDINAFRNGAHWVINRWWNRDELIAAGVTEADEPVAGAAVQSSLHVLRESLDSYDEALRQDLLAGSATKDVRLGDTALFRLFIGKRVLKSEVTLDGQGVPAYSANVFQPLGYIPKSNVADFSVPSVLWGIDGNFDFNLISAGVEFATTDHCGTIQILDPRLVPEYVLYALNRRRLAESFDRSFRASLSNMRPFTIAVPVTKDGTFNVAKQRALAKQFTLAQERRRALEAAKRELDALFERFLKS